MPATLGASSLWRRPVIRTEKHLRTRLRRLVLDRRGAAALEFAITGLAFFGLVLFVMSLGVRLYVQVALDYACSRAAQLLAVDSSRSLSGDVATFQNITFCPLLSAMLACANAAISLAPVADYSGTSTAAGTGPPSFDAGLSGSLMLLRVTYAFPLLIWPSPAGSGPSGGFGASISATYPYQNEY